eukprot:scaffold150380_cov28-Tisochrysis_lutea.AAC.10
MMHIEVELLRRTHNTTVFLCHASRMTMCVRRRRSISERDVAELHARDSAALVESFASPCKEHGLFLRVTTQLASHLLPVAPKRVFRVLIVHPVPKLEA